MTLPSIRESRLHLVETTEEALDFKRWLGERRDWLAIDTETSGFDWWRGELRLIQIGDAMSGWVLPAKWWGGVAKEAIEVYTGPIVFHNAKFDVHWLGRYGIKVPRHNMHDTQIMGHLVNNLLPTSLKMMAARLVDSSADQLQFDLHAAMKKHGWTWATVPLNFPTYWQYAAMDVILTARVADVLWPQVQASYSSLYDMESTTQQVLIDMEERGVRIDRAYCHQATDRMHERIDQLSLWMQSAYKIENPGSDAQVAARMMADGVVFSKFTATGKPSMEKEVLELIDHPLAKACVEMRHLTKIVSTYLQKFLDMADNDDILHPSLNLLGARTGRMSVSDPPLQNLERSRLVRDAFIPREGNALLMADYNQIELRLLAHYAHIDTIIDAARAGENLHEATARAIYGIAPGEPIPKRQYATTKNANFAKIYGAGIGTFAKTAGISEADATAFMTEYDKRLPGVSSFMNEVIRTGRNRDVPFVNTHYGRRLECAPRKEYKLVNYLIQGTAADVLKSAIVRCDAAGLLGTMVLPVHDEFVMDVPLEDVEELKHDLVAGMTDTTRFLTPLTVDAEVHGRWGDKYADF